MKVRWVFDLISPFAYLSLQQLASLPSDTELELVPVLFAGLLNHYGQLGPAEVPPKRRMGVPFTMPPAHPFNPLSALRLVIAAGGDLPAARIAFEVIWREGRDVSDPGVLADLASKLGIVDLQAALNDPNIKQTLRRNTEWAVGQGVFGVPTFVVGNELFWGHDAFEMVLDYLRDPGPFDDAQMRRIDQLPVGVARTRATPGT